MRYSPPDKTFFDNLKKVGIPVSLQALLFSLLGVTDILMVSQLGEAATAAVGVGNRIFFFNLIVIFGVSGALSVLASQYFGAQNSQGVRITLAQTLVLATAITLPFSLWYSLDSLSVVSIVSDDITYANLASEYLWITASVLVCSAVCVPIESALRSIGNSKLPTQISIYAIALNLLLNALLIFGLFGFPELGVVGAAIGTAASRAFQAALLSYLFIVRHREFVPRKKDIKLALTPHHLKRFLSIGLPLLIHDSAWAAGILIYNILIGQLGVSELAIIAFLTPIETALSSIFLGFAVGSSVILANEIGAHKYQRVQQTCWWYIGLSSFLALLIAICFWLLEPYIHYLLTLALEDNARLATNTFIVIVFSMTLRVLNMVAIGGVLKSGGDIKYTIFIDTFCQWCIGIPLVYYTGLVLGWELPWVMATLMIEEVAKMILATRRIQSGKWINNLVDDELVMQS